LLKSFAKYTNVDIDEAANLFDYMRHWPNRPNKLLFNNNNNNNHNLTCKAPVCAKKTSVALADRTSR